MIVRTMSRSVETTGNAYPIRQPKQEISFSHASFTFSLKKFIFFSKISRKTRKNNKTEKIKVNLFSLIYTILFKNGKKLLRGFQPEIVFLFPHRT